MNDQDRVVQVWQKIWQAFIDKTSETKNDFEGDKAAMKEIAAYGQEQYRAGAEAMRGFSNKHSFRIVRDLRSEPVVRVEDINKEAEKLLAEQEKKK